MTGSLSCPRCGAAVRAPGRWSDSWSCPAHGAVAPLHPPTVASDGLLHQLAQRSGVPLWLPWPLPAGWVISGLRYAGDEHTGPVATMVACSGAHPLAVDQDSERVADLLLIAEQPGVGLGAHLAGLRDLDPGDACGNGAATLKLVAAGHDTPLWALPVDLVAAYVGEASGVWLWALIWPATAAAVLLEQFELRDARDPGHRLDLPFGALPPRLA